MADERFMMVSSLMSIVELLRLGPGRARPGIEYTKPADDPEAAGRQIGTAQFALIAPAPDCAFARSALPGAECEAIKSWTHSAAASAHDLAVDERVLDVVVEEFTLRFGIEQSIVDFQGNVQVAISLAARERDVQFAGVIVVFDESHHR
jgi:hypothetical protein